MASGTFSKEIEYWLNNSSSKTIGDLQDVFDEKSFAILFLLFMFIPALPIPTGGITNLVLLPTVMIASIQMVFGRRSLWLPKRLAKIKLGEKSLQQGLPFMVRRIRWLEKYSRPRFAHLFDKAIFRTILGLSVFIFALASFIAPPFSWLDTLPSAGAVLIALAIILDDFAFYVAGLIVGSIGVGLIFAAAGAIITFVDKFI